MKRGIPTAYFSKGGQYFGRVQSTGHINTARQRKQCALYETAFGLELGRRILSAKVKNQAVVLKRYEKSRGFTLQEEQKMLTICRNKILESKSIAEMMGYEGQGAKYYFRGLSKCIDKPFQFEGRSRRPPRDEFNSMISLGYSILMNEVYGKIELKGLNPYFGFIHRDAEKHPTLASDMMEEWRAVIVDATVMSMINGHEIHKEDFVKNQDEPGCYLTKSGLKIFLNKLERKLQTEVRYLSYLEYSVSFRKAIFCQMERLVKDGVIDAIQLHGQEEEDVIRTLQRDLGCPVIKAFSVRSALDLQRAAGSCADYVLLDYGAGGTGHSFDWRLLEETPLNRPWFLAGGISPENALEAAQTGAWALDVSSGVETDGKKDPEKMSGIVRRIRNGERQIRHIRGTVHPGNIDE